MRALRPIPIFGCALFTAREENSFNNSLRICMWHLHKMWHAAITSFTSDRQNFQSNIPVEPTYLIYCVQILYRPEYV